MRGLTLLYAFIGGAVVGAGAALLFAPEKGEDLREEIRKYIQKYLGKSEEANRQEIEELVDEIAAEIKK